VSWRDERRSYLMSSDVWSFRHAAVRLKNSASNWSDVNISWMSSKSLRNCGELYFIDVPNSFESASIRYNFTRLRLPRLLTENRTTETWAEDVKQSLIAGLSADATRTSQMHLGVRSQLKIVAACACTIKRLSLHVNELLKCSLHTRADVEN
jgi:hypothetical protein